MGTAILFPQDCLRPSSRHKHQTPGMIFPPECSLRSRRNLPPFAHSLEAGLLPLPGHGRPSSPVSIPRRRSDSNHYKCRKGAEQRDTSSPMQHPTHREEGGSVRAQFLMLNDIKARSGTVVASSKDSENDGLDGTDKQSGPEETEFRTTDGSSSNLKHRSRGADIKSVKICKEGGSECQLKDLSKFPKGVQTSTVECKKLPGMKMGALKQKNAIVVKVPIGPDDSVRPPPPRVAQKPLTTKATGKVHGSPCQAVIVQCSEKHDNMLPCLRRTSTEPPQISAHILGQYRSKVMHIAVVEDLKRQSRVHGHGFSENTTSLSCQERWAGPAYTSSPSPSSLPLPKLCLPHTRFSSLEIPPLVKRYSTSVYMQPFLGSSAPSKTGGAWDVAFATKSLRKMLNLDPC